MVLPNLQTRLHSSLMLFSCTQYREKVEVESDTFSNLRFIYHARKLPSTATLYIKFTTTSNMSVSKI